MARHVKLIIALIILVAPGIPVVLAVRSLQGFADEQQPGTIIFRNGFQQPCDDLDYEPGADYADYADCDGIRFPSTRINDTTYG
jgi:hypothetical protein